MTEPTTDPRRSPPLQQGDRLTRDEFERRYRAMPGVKKAELIEGRVYMPSPVSHRRHGQPHFLLSTWLGAYVAATLGVEGSDNATVRIDLDNAPQPDLLLRIATRGGQTRLADDGFLEGAPELVVEIAASSVSYDVHDKLEVYRRSGVREYVVWRSDDAALDWFALREGRYEPLAPAEPIVRSEVFPGLWLDREALLQGDLPALLATLRRGTASDAHARFAAALAAASASS